MDALSNKHVNEPRWQICRLLRVRLIRCLGLHWSLILLHLLQPHQHPYWSKCYEVHCLIHKWNSSSLYGPSYLHSHLDGLVVFVDCGSSIYSFYWYDGTKNRLYVPNLNCQVRRDNIYVLIHSFRLPLGQCIRHWCLLVHHISCMCIVVLLVYIWLQWKWIFV